MQYFLPLQKFTFTHGYTQDIAITPSDKSQPRGYCTPAIAGREAGVLRNGHQIPQLHWTCTTLCCCCCCCCHCHHHRLSPGEMLMGCSVSSTQGTGWLRCWPAAGFLTAMKPLKQVCGAGWEAATLRGPWGFLLSPCGFIQLSPGRGTGPASPGWQQVEYQSTAFQAQHHQLVKWGDCPTLFCTGAASPWVLCVCSLKHHNIKKTLSY